MGVKQTLSYELNADMPHTESMMVLVDMENKGYDTHGLESQSTTQVTTCHRTRDADGGSGITRNEEDPSRFAITMHSS